MQKYRRAGTFCVTTIVIFNLQTVLVTLSSNELSKLRAIEVELRKLQFFYVPVILSILLTLSVRLMN